MIDTPCSCATLPCCLISAWPYVSLCVQMTCAIGSSIMSHQDRAGRTPVLPGPLPCLLLQAERYTAHVPCTCMCLEAFCCTGLAASANRFVIMDKYGLMPDPCDNSLIRMNNFLLLARCICDIAAIFDKNLRHAAQILDCLSAGSSSGRRSAA